jgi:hypothetical protein
MTPVPRDETLHLRRRLIRVTQIIDHDHQAAIRATRDRIEQAKSRRLEVQLRLPLFAHRKDRLESRNQLRDFLRARA